jgi:predicted nucleic acid-binding protein
MSRCLLDTSAYAAFLRDHPGARAAVQEASELLLSPVVLGELRSGFLKGGRPAENEGRLQEFLASPRCSVPVIDDETAHRYAAIHHYLRRQGTPVSPNDLWIAATAAQHGLTVVTLDGDFDRIPHVLVRKLPLSPTR